jgi:hypothetical protein
MTRSSRMKIPNWFIWALAYMSIALAWLLAVLVASYAALPRSPSAPSIGERVGTVPTLYSSKDADVVTFEVDGATYVMVVYGNSVAVCPAVKNGDKK